MTDPIPSQVAITQALEDFDWQQVKRNGGPPCFYRSDGHFCGRAQLWVGHSDKPCQFPEHKFTSLADLIDQAIQDATKDYREALRALVNKIRGAENSPSYQSVWIIAHLHGHRYIGPNWKDELEAVEKLLGA